MTDLRQWAQEYVEARGVLPEQAAARGLRPVRGGKPPAPDRLSADGFRPEEYAAHYRDPAPNGNALSGAHDGGLLIPLTDLRGEIVGYQLRVAKPVPVARGKPRKFLQPWRQRSALVAHPSASMLERLRSGGLGGAKNWQGIVVAEGVLRVDALASIDVPAVGITGCWNWRGTNIRGGATTLDDWDDVSIRGNTFLLALDGDVRTNSGVRAALEGLASLLRRRGAANVKVVDLPGKMGLDDWIAARRAEAMDAAEIRQALRTIIVDEAELEKSPALQRAEAQRKVRSDIERAIADTTISEADDQFVEWVATLRGDPNAYETSTFGASRRYLEKHGRETMVAYYKYQEKITRSVHVVDERGIWSGDDGAVIQKMDLTHAKIAAMLGMSRTTGEANSYIRNLLGQGAKGVIERIGFHVVPDLSEPSGSVTEDGVLRVEIGKLNGDGRYLGVANGVLDLRDPSRGALPAAEARTHFVTASAPVAYNPASLFEEPPAIRKLREAWGEEKWEFVLNWAGRGLWGAPEESFLSLVGTTRTGKGTFIAMLRGALGEELVQEMSRDVVRRGSGRDPKQGNTDELVALAAPSRFAFAEEVEDWIFGAARLKKYTGGAGTPFTITRKYKDPYPSTLTASLIFTANNTPHYGVTDPAIAKRAMTLRYEAGVTEDTSVKESLRRKYALEWFLAELVRRAQMNPPEQYLERPTWMVAELDERKAVERTQLQEFVDDELEVVPLWEIQAGWGHNTAFAEVWAAFCRYCGEPETAQEAGGVKQRAFSAGISQYLRIPPPVKGLRVNGKSSVAWRSLRFKGTEDTSMRIPNETVDEVAVAGWEKSVDQMAEDLKERIRFGAYPESRVGARKDWGIGAACCEPGCAKPVMREGLCAEHLTEV